MTIINKPNWSLLIGIPALIFLACFLVTYTQFYQSNQILLSNAILGDLLITSPLIYLWLIRKSSISNFTVLRTFLIGIVVAGLILKVGANPILNFIKTWVSPLAEFVVIFIIGRKFYVANKKAINEGEYQLDFLSHCRTIMYKVLGNEKAANLISSEIAVFYYAFFATKNRKINYHDSFSSYKENGIMAVLGAILGLFLVEAIGMHFLLAIWSKIGAWIITGLSLYTCVQLFAHIKAVRSRPIRINADTLYIHNGLAGDAHIDICNIEKIEMTTKWPVDRDAIKISLLKTIEGHNCVVYLKKPMQVTKIFGIKKWADTVIFFVDKPASFSNAIHAKLVNDQAT